MNVSVSKLQSEIEKDLPLFTGLIQEAMHIAWLEGQAAVFKEIYDKGAPKWVCDLARTPKSPYKEEK